MHSAIMLTAQYEIAFSIIYDSNVALQTAQEANYAFSTVA